MFIFDYTKTGNKMKTSANNYSLGFNRYLALSRKAKLSLFTHILLVEGINDTAKAHAREKELLEGLSEDNFKNLKKGKYLIN